MDKGNKKDSFQGFLFFLKKSISYAFNCHYQNQFRSFLCYLICKQMDSHTKYILDYIHELFTASLKMG